MESKYDIEEETDKKAIVLLLNTFLKNTLGVTVANKSRGKKAKDGIYAIKGIEVWKDANITIPKNSKAEFLEELNKPKEKRPKTIRVKKVSTWDSILENISKYKEIQVK